VFGIGFGFEEASTYKQATSTTEAKAERETMDEI
jgi:hypothetical protein